MNNVPLYLVTLILLLFIDELAPNSQFELFLISLILPLNTEY